MSAARAATRKERYPTPEGMPSADPGADRNATVFQVRRPDTLQFASVEGLGRMAGVGRHRLRRLIAKEATDNALDECDRVGRAGHVTVARDGDRYLVDDQGGGIQGDAATLADLFSAHRAMLSGKFLRLPRRGLLGNGLRCLCAAVALCGETLTVETGGRRTVLRPRRASATEIVEETRSSRQSGTRIAYTLGPIIPADDADLADATSAITLAQRADPAFARKPSPHWLDLDHLVETFETIEPVDATVRQYLQWLDGCSGAMAGKLAAPFGKGRTCRSMRDAEAAELLRAMQAAARDVKPHALGPIGATTFGDTFDGYIVAEAALRVGQREPFGHIPALIEAWGSVTSRRGGNAGLQIFCNRTPAVGGATAVRSYGNRIRLAGAGMVQDGPALEVEGGDCDLILAITAPLIPQTSLGKAADLSLMQGDIAEALRRAFNRSRNRLPVDPKQPKPPKAEKPPKPERAPPYEPSGLLATYLARQADAAGLAAADLLVLSPRHDPFSETKASRRDAEWFAEQIQRFVPHGKVHLRGAYYRILSAGDVRLPDGRRFTGTHETAQLVEAAGKHARHLGLVDFDRIVDERAAPPVLFDTEGNFADPAALRPIRRTLLVHGNGGAVVTLPAITDILPRIGATHVPRPRQPFRLCMIGEKTSLGPVLRSVAQWAHAELLLLTGEISESMAHGIIARAAEDGRPLRILYFADFDPSGWQMPVSLARKLQAHSVREFPNVDMRLIRVAMTSEQVEEFNLPDSPIKRGDKRAAKWRARWGCEQVEIDALAALRPELLDQIARDALAPYFDPTLDQRHAAALTLPDSVAAWFTALPAYAALIEQIAAVHPAAEQAIDALNKATTEGIEDLCRAVARAKDKPPIAPVDVQPEIEAKGPADAVFSTSDDFVTASQKLRAIKAYAGDEDGDEGGAP